MLLLLHKSDIEKLPADTPNEVRAKITQILETLDNEYGNKRNYENDGGYVAYISENEDNKKALADNVDIEFDIDTPELVDIIETFAGVDFINALYLFNNEYGVNLIMPKKSAPQSLLDELDEGEIK